MARLFVARICLAVAPVIFTQHTEDLVNNQEAGLSKTAAVKSWYWCIGQLLTVFAFYSLTKDNPSEHISICFKEFFYLAKNHKITQFLENFYRPFLGIVSFNIRIVKYIALSQVEYTGLQMICSYYFVDVKGDTEIDEFVHDWLD